MDALIQLIVWLFRTLFGQQEPPAELGPKREFKRGPYVYGDESTAPGTGRQKTLAELLEEARAELHGQTAPPPSAPKTVSPEPPTELEEEKPPPRRPVAPAVKAPTPKSVFPTAAPPLARQVTMARPAHLADRPVLRPVPAAPEAVRVARVARMPGPHAPASTSPGKAPAQPAPHGPPKIPAAARVESWLAALGEAKGKEKADFARQGILALTVLGPPRCSVAHRSVFSPQPPLPARRSR
jgi:hypothetical protein